MNLKDTIICWKPETGEMKLERFPDREGRSQGWRTNGAVMCEVHKLSFEERKKRIFVEAMHIIVRDKIDPQLVHETLLNLDEYRDGCSDDMPGHIR
jgi:hypothetical protein